MTRLSYDETTWGLIVTICALVLAFPLSLAANLVTPLLKNWWAERSAERSIESLQARIDEMEKKLARAEAAPLFSHGELAMMRGMRLLALLIIGAANFLLAIFGSVFGSLAASNIMKLPKPFLVALLVMYLLLFLSLITVPSMFQQEIIAGTEEGRTKMRESIAKLKEKRASKAPRTESLSQ